MFLNGKIPGYLDQGPQLGWSYVNELPKTDQTLGLQMIPDQLNHGNKFLKHYKEVISTVFMTMSKSLNNLSLFSNL